MLKRIISVLIFVLLLPGVGWGATYYVRNSAGFPGTKIMYLAGAWPPDDGTGATDNSDISAVLTAAGGSDTIVIAAGTYTATQLRSTNLLQTAKAGQTIRGATTALDSGSTGWQAGFAGTVTINGGGLNYAVQVSHNDTFKGLTFTNSGGTYSAVYLRTSGTLDNCIITAAYFCIEHNCAAASTTTLNRCKIVGNGQKLFVASNTNPTLNANYCYFDYNYIGNSLPDWSNNANFNNCNFDHSYSLVLQPGTNNTVTINLNNCIIAGNGLSAANVKTINNAQGNVTMTATNSLMLPNPWDPDNYNFTGITIGASNKQSSLPGWSIPKYPAILVLCVDDVYDTSPTTRDYISTSVLPYVEKYGFKMTWAMNRTNVINSANWTLANSMVASGHEISCHTRDHWPLAILTTFTIQKAGATVDIGNNTLTITPGAAYDLTTYNLTTLRTALVADGVTCGTDPNSTVPATVLNNVVGQSINSAHTLVLNEGKLLKAEIDPSITDIQTNIPGYTVTSFTPPGNSTGTNLRSYLHGGTVGGETITQAFAGARGNPTVPGNHLNSINIYNLAIRDVSNIGATTNWEAGGGTRINGIKRNIAALCSALNQVGGVMVLYFHSATEMSADDWDAMVSVLKSSNVQVMTLSQAINYCKTYDPSSDLASADGLTYTRTLISNQNMALKPGSDCINGGTSAPGIYPTTDFVGNAVPNVTGGISIGAYEYETWGGGGLTAGLGLSGGNAPPWIRKRP